MTQREVEEILGGPAGEYTTGEWHEAVELISRIVPISAREEVWRGNRNPVGLPRFRGALGNGLAITVYFDEDGQVIHKDAMPLNVTEKPFWERVWRRLKGFVTEFRIP
jgi:hypothetical protein